MISLRTFEGLRLEHLCGRVKASDAPPSLFPCPLRGFVGSDGSGAGVAPLSGTERGATPPPTQSRPPPFSIGGINAAKSGTTEPSNDLQKAQIRVKIVPVAALVEREHLLIRAPRNRGGLRGRIEGFSKGSSRRFKEVLATRWVPGFEVWKVALTTHRAMSDAEWAAILKRWNWHCIEYGWGMQWRVQDQPRVLCGGTRAPHLHGLLWTSPKRPIMEDEIRVRWLQCTGELNDSDAMAHAVYCELGDGEEYRWMLYVALHDSTGKAMQERRHGRQWGVINRRLFVDRVPAEFAFDDRQHACFLRTCERYDRSQALRQLAFFRVLASTEKDPGKLAELRRKCRSVCKRLGSRIHRGNALQLGVGAAYLRIAQWVQAAGSAAAGDGPLSISGANRANLRCRSNAGVFTDRLQNVSVQSESDCQRERGEIGRASCRERV